MHQCTRLHGQGRRDDGANGIVVGDSDGNIHRGGRGTNDGDGDGNDDFVKYKIITLSNINL